MQHAREVPELRMAWEQAEAEAADDARRRKHGEHREPSIDSMSQVMSLFGRCLEA